MAVPTGPGTSSDIAKIAQQADFVNRVMYYVTGAAVDVMAEPANTPDHAARVAFAQKALSGNYYVQGAVNAVLSNPSIAAESDSREAGANIPDGDLEFAVNSLFDALAGVNK